MRLPAAAQLSMSRRRQYQFNDDLMNASKPDFTFRSLRVEGARSHKPAREITPRSHDAEQQAQTTPDMFTARLRDDSLKTTRKLYYLRSSARQMEHVTSSQECPRQIRQWVRFHTSIESYSQSLVDLVCQCTHSLHLSNGQQQAPRLLSHREAHAS